MDAVKLLGDIIEVNATNGHVLGELLRRTATGDALGGVIAHFAAGTIASGRPHTLDPGDGLLTILASGGAPPVTHQCQNEAVLLLQALCNAAKVDGAIAEGERSAMLAKVPSLEPEAAEFVDAQLAAPLDVRDFASRVPESLAHQVYGFSMMGLPAGSRQQVQFLSALAQGLDIDWIAAKKIHGELGGPNTFG